MYRRKLSLLFPHSPVSAISVLGVSARDDISTQKAAQATDAASPNLLSHLFFTFRFMSPSVIQNQKTDMSLPQLTSSANRSIVLPDVHIFTKAAIVSRHQRIARASEEPKRTQSASSGLAYFQARAYNAVVLHASVSAQLMTRKHSTLFAAAIALSALPFVPNSAIAATSQPQPQQPPSSEVCAGGCGECKVNGYDGYYSSGRCNACF